MEVVVRSTGLQLSPCTDVTAFFVVLHLGVVIPLIDHHKLSFHQLGLVMQSTHPLEIPEIISCVASYVRKHNLKACALVSKTWYQAFNPFIWHDITWNRGRRRLPVAIHRHTQLVKTLKAKHNLKETKELLDLIFPNLASLDLTYALADDMKKWVLGHSSVTRLSLHASGLNPVFWNTLLGFRHLKDLTVWHLDLGRKDVDTFWQLCTHLERLKLSYAKMTHAGNNTLSMAFPSIKDLELSNCDDEVKVFLMLMQRCPSLTSLRIEGMNNLKFISSFSELVAAETWPHLHSLTLK
ncbi:hypothetical protein BGZ65_002666 [Modicella reniformis]|uniref:F-box domain-containing protein n=1 Tax=Modicella reniformis TaxID=1440133 RepID=A0A9P6LSS5_9FUNG|nr:hypothetical protein BGZ65_002666 [Modicella reniformis]